MHRLLILAAAAMPLVATSAGAAELVQYDFTGQSGSETSVAASATAANLTALAFTRGAGLVANSGSGSINSKGWDDLAANDYYDFGFSITGGVSATVSQLIFGDQASATGPGTINVLAAVDGGAFTKVGSFTIPTATTQFNQALSLTPLTGSSSIEFRFEAANATAVNGSAVGNAGTFRVTNNLSTDNPDPFTIVGTVNTPTAGPVPEPATWAMMITGFGIAGTALRRRTRVRAALAA